MNTESDTNRTQLRETSHHGPQTNPSYQVIREDEGVRLHVSLPGVTRNSLSVSLQDNLLVVTGKRHFTPPGDWTCHRSSSQPGDYQLKLRLHPDLDPASIKAELAEGILTLSLSRKESARARQIAVN